PPRARPLPRRPLDRRPHRLRPPQARHGGRQPDRPQVHPRLTGLRSSRMERTGAAAVIIGNEILTAKVTDANGPHLVRRLRDRGVPLASIAVVPDDVDAIVEAVASAHRRARHVLTSGGIGPTHDDVTVRAVALALGRKVVRLEEMVKRIRDHYGEGVPAAALRMADAPEGAELWIQEGTWFPVLTCDGVHMLPGVPQL